MKNAIWKFDEDLDEEISMNELINFLDSNMPEGKEFDRNLADQIFSVFDTDGSGSISIDEFIKTYIHITEELKAHKAQVKAKYQAEKDKMDDLIKKANSYKGERLNHENLAPNAKLTCEIINVELASDFNEFNNIKIRLTLGRENFETKAMPVNNRNITLKEIFNL